MCEPRELRGWDDAERGNDCRGRAAQGFGKSSGDAVLQSAAEDGCSDYVKNDSPKVDYQFAAANFSTDARSRSKAIRSSNFPLKMRARIFCVLWMSASGFALRRSRSATFPASIVPCVWSLPRNSAG